MSVETVDILAFGPHPDDVEMGCGGTIVKMVRAGYTAGIADLTAGEMGTRGTREIRAREAEEAANVLGVRFRENLNIPDGSVRNTDENREKLSAVIRKYRPRIIMAGHVSDDHPDHVHAAGLIRDAAYLAGLQNYPPESERHRTKALVYYMNRRDFEPTFIVDITEVFERKIEAIRKFASQFHNEQSRDPETPLSRPGFIDLFRIRARHYGRMIGCEYGEPFFTESPPPLHDPVAAWC